jgi:hypothetical protein
MAIPAEYDEVLLRMLNVIEALAQAGPPEGFGDDDGGRLFNSRRNRTEHMTDPLALGAIIYDRNDLGAAELTEESIWLFGERAVAGLKTAVDQTPKAASSTAFADGGIYVLAGESDSTTGSQPLPHLMTIDAGPLGQGRCGHGHADALSLRLTMNGERWLVDSGSGVYISSDPADRNIFRGTRAHNTIRVDGLDQAAPDQPFSWTQIPTTQVEEWILGHTFTYFVGSHNGYARLADPVTHRRCVLHLNDGISLVRDVVAGNGEHDLELRWHLASDIAVREVGAGDFVASRAKSGRPLALRMVTPRLTLPAANASRMRQLEQTYWSTQLTRGLVSPAYGQYQSAPVLYSEARAKLPAEIATALVAHSAAAQTQDEARMIGRHDENVQVYELHAGNQGHEFFFAIEKQPWTFGPWSTDAELLYCRIEHEKLVQLIAVGGSTLECQGRALFNGVRPYKFFEWRKRDGITHSEPSPVSTTPWFDELTDGSQPSSNLNVTSSYAEKH